MPVGLVPVEHDPFNGGAGGGMSLVPVEHNPWDIGAALPEGYQNPSVGVGALIKNALTGMVTLPRRALDASAADVGHLGEAGYEPQSIAPSVETALTMMGGSGAVPAEANSLRMGIKAYHGSPHDFDAFDLSKIGTGEGAQAYGHGLYFAENPGVAKEYRDTLGMNQRKWLVDNEVVGQYGQNNSANGVAAARLRQIMGDDGIATAEHVAAAKADLLKVAANNPGLIRDIQKQLEAMDGMAGRHIAQDAGGKMYEVNINADPAHFLDWDKPLSQQPKQIQDLVGYRPAPTIEEQEAMIKRLKDSGIAPENLSSHPEFTKMQDQLDRAAELDRRYPHGQALVDNFAQLKGDTLDNLALDHSQVSSKLNEAGIPGIKYLDQGSRGKAGWRILPPNDSVSGKWVVGHAPNGPNKYFENEAEARSHYEAGLPATQSHNYVVFNDKLIDIVRKYAAAGIALPPAIAVEYARNFKPVDHDPFAEAPNATQ